MWPRGGGLAREVRRTFAGWAAPALLVAIAGALIAREPVFWKRYVLSIGADPFDRAAALGAPREIVAGSDQPPMPRASPEEQNVDPTALQAAADYAASRAARALVVSRRGHLVYEKYWPRAEGDEAPLVADGFAGTIAAVMIGFAIDERAIGSMYEPVARHFREWERDSRAAITVRDLLQMSSGLAPAAPAWHPWSPDVRRRLGTRIATEFVAAPLSGRPGRDWNPQSGDTQLLASLLERATGERYAQYVSRKLWKPLGAGDAYVTLDRHGGTAHVTCCFSAKAADWMRFGDALARDGVYQGEQVIPAGWVRAMRTPAAGNVRYGFHVWLGDETYAADDVMVLEGGPGTRLWIVPSLELVILAAAGPHDSHLPNLIVRGLSDFVPKRVERDADDPARYVPGH
jgi:CubicO group peptidase (beta-lactamase class C family)